jgi:hypothetical protein
MRAATAKVSCAVLTLAIAGCATNQPPPTPPPPAPVFSFDGTYNGTIHLTSSAVSGKKHKANRCDTPPQLSLTVQNNAFSYLLTHLNTPKGVSLTLTAKVGPDGSIAGSDVSGGTTMDGLIAGSQMSGHINGTACNYAFTAVRQ